MRTKGFTLAVILLACAFPSAGQKLMGLVVQKNAQGLEEALPGANVHWVGGKNVATSGENGIFLIEREGGKDRLVVSFVGFLSDTVLVTNQTSIKVELKSTQVLQEVVVEGWKPSTGLDHARGINTIVMLEKELFKAACCNLSESFETNPSVDVAFTDAITGTRQIQMLGLSGPNTLISIENMPGVRGLASSQGIQLIPGTWINSIEVTKGVGPVVNGYESIAGQINVELKKPQESEKLYLNGYLNQSGRSEVNLNLTAMAGKKWATTLLLHGSTRPFEMDSNDDSFLDFPTGSQLNVINRWVFNSGTGWLGQFGVKVLRDDKRGGQEGFEEMDKFTTNRYGLEINTKRLEGWGKLGYQFPMKPFKSVGLQLSATRHDHNSFYGFTTHDGEEKSAYANLIYQSIIGSTNHKFKTGLSFQYSNFDERLFTLQPSIIHRENGTSDGAYIVNFDREEVVPGAFVEYTYDYLNKFSLIAGARVDQHNLFGTIFTPRLHLRTNLSETSTLRLSAGKGTRLANILIENTGMFASSRQINFMPNDEGKAYGFKPDVAWNYGMNFSQDFTLDYRAGTITLDYYYTNFKEQAVVDFDVSPGLVYFHGLGGGKSYSHSAQLQVDYQLMRRLDLRLAYRYLDVQTIYLQGMLTKPLVSKHRAFANIAYETKNRWKFDYTVQWLGEQRIPYTQINPAGYRLPEYSPAYFLMNAQISKDLKSRWSVYLGVENITNYTLSNPIVAASEPFSPYFDSSMVWGPIFGRMAYAGFRYRVK